MFKLKLIQQQIWPGACRGLVFGGRTTPDLTAPGVTPDHTAPPKILTDPFIGKKILRAQKKSALCKKNPLHAPKYDKPVSAWISMKYPYMIKICFNTDQGELALDPSSAEPECGLLR